MPHFARTDLTDAEIAELRELLEEWRIHKDAGAAKGSLAIEPPPPSLDPKPISAIDESPPTGGDPPLVDAPPLAPQA